MISILVAGAVLLSLGNAATILPLSDQWLAPLWAIRRCPFWSCKKFVAAKKINNKAPFWFLILVKNIHNNPNVTPQKLAIANAE